MPTETAQHARCCSGGLARLFGRKLGACTRCMRASALLAAAAWATVAAIVALWPQRVVVLVAVTVAIGFSALALAHLIALTRRIAALHDEAARALGIDRRAALGSLSRAVIGAALFGFGVWTPRSARAQSSPQPHPTRSPSPTPSPTSPPERCEGEHPRQFTIGPVRVCAATNGGAVERATPLLRESKDAREVRKAAEDVCKDIAGTPQCKRCRLDHLVFGAVDCEADKPPTRCPGGQEFLCQVLVLRVVCTCG